MAAKPDTAYLYVIGTLDGPVKIGHSLAPQRRLDDFRREGREVVVVGTWPLGRSIALATERYVHWQLKEHHIRGEWFNVPRPDVLAAIHKALNRINEIDGRNPIPSLDRHGPKIRFAESAMMRFSEGTFARIQIVLDDGEDRTSFVREAVERELMRRELKEAI